MEVRKTLPNELWIKVLQDLDTDDDLSFLWITCRQVCTVFKDATESMFRDKLLPKLRINFLLGDFYPPTLEDRRFSAVPLSCEFEFERLLEDISLATMGVEELPEELKPMIRKRMREFIPETHLDIPHHTIQIRRDVNDGPIPGLSFDFDNFQVQCDWIALFSAFYGEEFCYHQILGAAVARRGPWLEELKVKVDRKEMDPQQVIMKALEGFAEDNTLARKMARRARLKKQMQDFDGTEWEFVRDGNERDEDRFLKNLQQFRQFASFEEWSDEDDDEGADGDSEEQWQTEDEEDDWEDEGSAEDDE